MTIRSIAEVIAGRELHTISPAKTARDASAMMEQAKVDGLVVVEDGALVGVLCEQDIIRKCMAQGLHSDDTPVSAIMTPDPLTVEASGKLADAFKLMVDRDIHHLPVLQDGKVIGMMLKGDVPTDYRMMMERFQEYQKDTTAA